ncbi:gp53-like domain-containing protein [Pseudomonas citronellolis]|uniref:gp53-like domain-containing protein n=1 Tax=Pseudomonas citronellolis TaxID=53408 RepID=UPI0023E3A3E4|nr:hypothetical protein [Pseudomonas citronellolis]MDF3936648.1 hypothetical protein [Pseudomonas citronellolis]
MANNDFLPFAGGVGSNVLTQAAYAALATRTSGFSSGLAKSAELNKVWRQSSIIAAVIGQLIANRSGSDAVDDGSTAALLTSLEAAIGAVGRLGGASYVVDTGSANTYVAAYTPAVTTLVDGMILRFKAATANTGASTFNPNGLGAKPIVGGAHAALQGGEIVVNSDVWLQYNSSIGSGSWILIDSTGGAIQTPPATQSQQAVNLGQFLATLTVSGYQKLPSGLIIQWGSVTNSATTGSPTAVTLPIAFPTAARSVLITSTVSSTTPAYAWVDSVTASGFNSRSNTANSGAYYIAIGY